MFVTTPVRINVRDPLFSETQVQVGLVEARVAPLLHAVVVVARLECLHDLRSPGPGEAVDRALLELPVVGRMRVADPDHCGTVRPSGGQEASCGLVQALTRREGHRAGFVEEVVQHVDDQHRGATRLKADRVRDTMLREVDHETRTARRTVPSIAVGAARGSPMMTTSPDGSRSDFQRQLAARPAVRRRR